MASTTARRWFLLERKSFEITLEGLAEDLISITEFGKKRRTSISLNREEARWFTAEWPLISGDPRSNGKCARFKAQDRTLFLSMQCNISGWFLNLLEIKKSYSKSISFPEGADCAGWRRVLSNCEAIVQIAWPKPQQKQIQVNIQKRDFPPLPKKFEEHLKPTAAAWGPPKEIVKEKQAWGPMKEKEKEKQAWGPMKEKEKEKQAWAPSKEKEKVNQTSSSVLPQCPPKSSFSIRFDCPTCRGSIEGTINLSQIHSARSDGAAQGATASGSDAPTAKKREKTSRPKVTRSARRGRFGPRPILIKKEYRPKLGCRERPSPQGEASSCNSFVYGPLVIYNEPIPNPIRETEPAPSVQPLQGKLFSTEAPLPSSPTQSSDQGEFFSPAGSPHATGVGDLALTIFDPAIPLSVEQDLTDEAASDWVLSSVSGLSKQLGLCFDGFEAQALKLFSDIEKKRLLEANLAQKTTPKASGMSRELKRLEFGVNYGRSSSLVEGTARSSGKKVFNG